MPKPWTIAVALAGAISKASRARKAEKGDAVARRLAPAQSAASSDRLAGHDLGDGDALVHRIGVHEPGHDLFVGAEVRRHHVDPRADERNHLLHVAAGKILELLWLERARVDRDPTLAAAEGKIGERAFPAHPDGERCDFADVDVRGESGPAPRGAERQVVLDAKAGEDIRPAVLHPDRAGDDDRALRVEEPVALVLGDVEMVGDDDELVARHLEHWAAQEALHIRSPARRRRRRRNDSGDRDRRNSKFFLGFGKGSAPRLGTAPGKRA